MNDFTKEDLENLLICINDYSHDTWKKYGDPFYPDLKIKVQSMIDNYCEHNPEKISFSSCPIGSDMKYQCKKCGEFYHDQ